MKGALNHAPDAHLRNPVSDLQPQDMLIECDDTSSPETTIAEIRAIISKQQESVRLQDLRKHGEYQQLTHYIRNGFPEHWNQMADECKRYWNVQSELALDDDLIVYGCRVLIPTKMRYGILPKLHESHQGSVHTKQRA